METPKPQGRPPRPRRREPRRRRPARGAGAAVLGAATLGALAAVPAPAAAQPLGERTTLSGDWGGRREAWQRRGLHLEGSYLGDVLANTRGGVRRDLTYLDSIELKVLLDLEPLLGWRDARLLAYGLRNNGGSISADVGDAQGVDNIETVNDFKLYEAWLQQNLLDNRVSVLAGLYDVNSEFDVMRTAGLFLNSSHGMGAEFAASGLAGPSTFPFTSVSLRVKVLARRNVYVQALVADGVPGDPTDPASHEIAIRKEEGAFLAGELGWYRFASQNPQAGEGRGGGAGPAKVMPRAQRKYIGREVAADYDAKLAVGVWGYTSNFELLRLQQGTAFVTPERDRGVYVLADWRVLREDGDPAQGLSVFGRVGRANDAASRFDLYVGAGCVVTGGLPGRPSDTAGVALAWAHNSRYFESVTPDAHEDFEAAVEATYRFEAFPWLALQPDVQWVIHPGGETSREAALVVGLRVEAAL